MTTTFATLDVSAAFFEEVQAKLEKANYQHTFIRWKNGDVFQIVMDGIALEKAAPVRPTKPVTQAILPDLDPGGVKALAYLNELYAEEYQSWDELDRDMLAHWLRQVLLELRLEARSSE